MSSIYSGAKVVVTGGAGFIGYRLSEKLIELGARVVMSGDLNDKAHQKLLYLWNKANIKYKKRNYGYDLENGSKFVVANFENLIEATRVIEGNERVFHLAAVAGGRGFIEDNPAECCRSFSINSNVIRAASMSGVNHLLFSSSACVYPVDEQNTYSSRKLLKEGEALKNGWGNADREYGWAKLMGELTLNAYGKQYGLKGGSVRYMTIYGPWMSQTHAVLALIDRAVKKEDPFLVWGNGRQERDFCFVDDIVDGLVLAGAKITDGRAINLGTSKRHSITEVVEIIFNRLKWRPNKIVYDMTKPIGVKNRSLDFKQARLLLGWKPKVSFEEGISRTIEWYVSTRI